MANYLTVTPAEMRKLRGLPPQGKKPKYFYRPKPVLDGRWWWTEESEGQPPDIGDAGFEDWARMEYEAMLSDKRSLFGQIPPPMLQAREIPLPGTQVPDVTWKRRHGREIKAPYGSEGMSSAKDWIVEGVKKDGSVSYVPWKYGADQWNHAKEQATLRLEEAGLKLTKANLRAGTILALADQAQDDAHAAQFSPAASPHLDSSEIFKRRQLIEKQKAQWKGKPDKGKESMDAKLNRHLEDSKKNREIKKALEKK